MRIRSFAILVLALAASAVACERTSESTAPRGGAEPPGLLVVSRAETSIFTIKPDGSARTDLVAEQSGLVAIQPTWSPDGTRLVWTEVDHMSEVPEPSIVTSGPRGENPERVPAPVAPFYFHWNPKGGQVAFLAGGPGGRVDLGLLDGELRFLGGAQPYYFAWAPDGRTLLTHTDLETVALLTLDGRATTLAQTESRFQAPQWAADGTRLVYATGAPPATGGVRIGAFQTDGQEIVVTEIDGTVLSRLGPFAGVATFELSPDGRQIAHSVTPARDAFNFGPLVVTDLDSGEATTVSDQSVLAFQWSPLGDLLLYLIADEGPEHPTFRWAVWNGEQSSEYSVVVLTPGFASSYLPFWDQYSRSHTVWAPDGSAFAYTGLDGQGDSTVWVQLIGDDSEPRQIAAGDIVFWSPAAQ
jgi:Tol biopolymer transport system component